MFHGARAVAVMAVAVMAVAVMAAATAEVVTLVDTGVHTSAAAMVVDTSGVATLADIILPAGIMAVLM
jgi:hypothetical protein